MTNINFRVEESVKEKASKLFAELGLDMSTALNMFLRQSLIEGGMPFTPSIAGMKNAGITVIENEEQLDAALEFSNKEILEGKTISNNIVRKRVREKYGI